MARSAPALFSPTRRLTVLYIVALSCVGLLSFLSLLFVHGALAREKSATRVVNIAGRQRMLSQKIAKCALILGQDGEVADRLATRRELYDSVSTWSRSHIALVHGDDSLEIPAENSPDIARRLQAVEPHLLAVRASSLRLLALTGDKPAPHSLITAEVRDILSEERPFLNGMDALVFAMDREAASRVSRLQALENFFFGWILVVLLVEGLFIFRPATHNIRVALRSLHRSESRHRALLAAMPDATLLFDVNGHLLEARPIAAENMARPLEAHFARHLKALQAKGESKTFEFRDEESGRDYEARLVLLESEEVGGALALVRDITDRKEMDRLKDDFIATVSHELKTPLTSIRGSLGLLHGGVAGELPPRAASLVAVAHQNCERLSQLVNDILDLEHIKAGQIQLSLEEVAVDEAVQRAVEASRAFAGEFGVQYTLDLQSHGVVRADANRLAQILTNLLSNAAKFSPRGENVRVATMRKTDETGRWLRVSVEDSGPGIAPDFEPRIFGKFAQADATDARTTQGSGLGLSIARALTEKLGGRIGFDSNIGKGSTFWVEWREAVN